MDHDNMGVSNVWSWAEWSETREKLSEATELSNKSMLWLRNM